jgi:Uma2 family endonuclease
MVAAQAKRMTEEEFRAFSLRDNAGQWELVRGELREKPPMTARHGGAIDHLLAFHYAQLGRNEFRIRTTHARLRRSADTYYIPAITVIPTALVQMLLDHPDTTLDAYPESLPLVIEIWSPSTGRYDIREKLPDYQARGDREIWYVHPYERTLIAWRRQLNGTYTETIYRNGVVRLESLPSVAFDLEAHFEP